MVIIKKEKPSISNVVVYYLLAYLKEFEETNVTRGIYNHCGLE